MKPSELIKILQQAIDKGLDDEIEIVFDTDFSMPRSISLPV